MDLVISENGEEMLPRHGELREAVGQFGYIRPLPVHRYSRDFLLCRLRCASLPFLLRVARRKLFYFGILRKNSLGSPLTIAYNIARISVHVSRRKPSQLSEEVSEIFSSSSSSYL